VAKKAYVRNSDNTAWVELASATTDLSNYLTSSSASSTYLTQIDASETYLSQTSASTNYATKEYADTVALTSASITASNAISSLVDSSPSTLDTLNELAAALGDDPNFATTITNLIAEKMTSVPGVINQFAGSGSASPTGWLFCDGQEVLISSYINLYNALTSNGSTFPYGGNTNGSGGAGSTHFRIPNFKGRVPVGRDSSQTEFDVLGESGGAKTHTLTSAEMPSHTHTQNAHNHGISDPSHIHDVSTATGGHPAVTNYVNQGVFGVFGFTPSTVNQASGYGRTWFADVSQTGITINNSTPTNQNSGSGGAHNNLQPYITINYIIKT
jgi:microcystin-dependent protein